MALVLYDRVRETTNVLGTADAILLGAVTGFQSFAVVGNSNTCYYTIADANGNWETGLGTYSSVGPTLARTTVYSSSNSNAKVNFPAGSKDIFLTYLAEKAVQLDSSGNVSPLGTVASGTWQATAITTTYGGTGLTSYTAGDLLYYSTGTTLSKLAIGAANTVLTSSGTAPQFSTSLNLAGSLTAAQDSSFTSTGALLISKGTTVQQPGSPVTGMIRYNTTDNQFEGYSGASPSWKSIGGSAISNDTSTATFEYPLFASATTGTATTVYTSDSNYLYKPSTGDLQAMQTLAKNGIDCTATTVSVTYTLPTNYNALSAGPITVNSGVTVTVPSGSVWVVV